MGKVRIVTDSNASIPPEVLERYPIEIIPHTIRFGRERIEETPDLTVDDLFQQVRQGASGGSLPELDRKSVV